MVRVKADGRTVTAVRRHRESRFVFVFFRDFESVVPQRSVYLCGVSLQSIKTVCIPPSLPLLASSCALRARQPMHNRRVPSSFSHNSIVPLKVSLIVGLYLGPRVSYVLPDSYAVLPVRIYAAFRLTIYVLLPF